MKDPIIYPLFSAPVYAAFDTGITLPDEDLEFLASLPGLEGSWGLSKDIDVLALPQLAEARKLCEYHLQQYIDQVCSFTGQEFYITNSWLSRNPQGADHYRHNHPNSMFSGCLYLRSNPDSRLSFHGENHFTRHWPLTYTQKDLNIYNSSEWWLPADTGTLIIFPSNLVHSANVNTQPETRIALCWNSFIRGTLGNPGDYAARLEVK